MHSFAGDPPLACREHVMTPPKGRGPAARQSGAGPKRASSLQRKANSKRKTSQPQQEAPYGNKRRLAIPSGRDVLGHVVGDGDRWEARSSNENDLIGVYTTRIEANNAIIAEVAS